MPCVMSKENFLEDVIDYAAKVKISGRKKEAAPLTNLSRLLL